MTSQAETLLPVCTVGSAEDPPGSSPGIRSGRVSWEEALMRLLMLMPRLLPALDLLLPLLPDPCFHPSTAADVRLRGRVMSPPVRSGKHSRRNACFMDGLAENKEIGGRIKPL